VTDFTVRRATVADVPVLVEFRLAFVHELTVNEADDHDVRREVESYLLRSIADESFVAWLAESGGEAVGTAGMVPYERMVARGTVGREAYVMNVYTLPEWRKRGIGEAMMNEIVAFAGERDIKLALLATEDGRGLYSKTGFRHDDRYFRWG